MQGMKRLLGGGEDVPEGSVKHFGWLTKVGGKNKSWKRRWVKLLRTNEGEYIISYHKSESTSKALGIVPLSTYRVCCEATAESLTYGRRYLFKLANDERTGVRTFLFGAGDAVSMSEWIQHLEKVLQEEVRKQRESRVERADTSELGRVARFHDVYCNVTEAKGCGDSSSRMRFCRIRLDGGAYVIRSPYVGGGDNPVFLEEHKLDAGMSRVLEVALFEQGERLLGALRVPLESIEGKLHQGWHQLGTEVAVGDVDVELDLFRDLLKVNVHAVRNLDIAGGAVLYAQVTRDDGSFNDDQRTSAAKWDSNVQVAKFENEQPMIFNQIEKDNFHLTVDVRYRAGGSIGTVNVCDPVRNWYSLVTSTGPSDCKLKLKMRYDSYVALPRSYYAKLVNLLREDYFRRTLELAAELLNASAEVKVTFSEALVDVFLMDPLISNLFLIEVQLQSAETLFRANSIASKAMDYLQRSQCKRYLRQTIGSIIEGIFVSDVLYEVDPDRPGYQLLNRDNLWQLVSVTLGAVFRSLPTIPKIVRAAHEQLAKSVSNQFDDELALRSIASFFFLRLITPAILGPKLFGLAPKHPDANTGRVLTLVAKIVQNVANFQLFGAKEPYLKVFNQDMEEMFQPMREFLKALSVDDGSGTHSDSDSHSEKPYPVLCRVLSEMDLGPHPKLQKEVGHLKKLHSQAAKAFDEKK